MICGPPPDPDHVVTNNNTIPAPLDNGRESSSSLSCKFFSFGIRDDPSWDIHLSKEWKCHGFAGDPSIVHPSKLHGGVTFHNIGLNVMRPNVEQKVDPEADWILVGLPQLKKFLGWDYVDIVKVRCKYIYMLMLCFMDCSCIFPFSILHISCEQYNINIPLLSSSWCNERLTVKVVK